MSPGGRIRMALPKGRVAPALERLLTIAGMPPAEAIEGTRKLVAEVPRSEEALGVRLELLLLKNADVPVYVEHGVADVGVAGTDLLYETGAAVLRPYTFDFGGCDLVLAGLPDHDTAYLRRQAVTQIATKYLRFARDHFARAGWPVELIPLSGSVELAPLLGLADAIVDLSETGKTLAENGLVVHDVIGHTQVKFIANRALSKRTTAAVETLIAALAAAEASAAESGTAL
jgi:ATP phosphoribosyltransferase